MRSSTRGPASNCDNWHTERSSVLGPKATELARAALLDERGARINDDRALRHFARAFRELQRLDAVANEASAEAPGEA